VKNDYSDITTPKWLIFLDLIGILGKLKVDLDIASAGVVLGRLRDEEKK